MVIVNVDVGERAANLVTSHLKCPHGRSRVPVLAIGIFTDDDRIVGNFTIRVAAIHNGDSAGRAGNGVVE